MDHAYSWIRHLMASNFRSRVKMPKGPSGQQFEPGPPKWALILPAAIGMAFGTIAILRNPATQPTMVMIVIALLVLCVCAGAVVWSRHVKKSQRLETQD
jgi:hypothetical protein